jgi:hypothetical protein
MKGDHLKIAALAFIVSISRVAASSGAGGVKPNWKRREDEDHADQRRPSPMRNCTV